MLLRPDFPLPAWLFDRIRNDLAEFLHLGRPLFGPDGEGFERINIACPRATVEKALKQLEAAIRG